MQLDEDIEITAVSLTGLSDGAAIAMFDEELQKVAKNIADPNTSAKKARKITLTVTMMPDEERGAAVTGIQVVSSLAPIKPKATTVFFRELRDGRVEITEYNTKQPQLPLGKNVREFERKEVV